MSLLNNSWADAASVTQPTFTGSNVLGQQWILPVIITVFVALIVTRDIKKWPIIIFPTLLIFIGFGTWIDTAILIIAVIMFVLSTVTWDQLTSAIGATTSIAKEGIFSGITTRYRMNRAIRDKTRERQIEDKTLADTLNLDMLKKERGILLKEHGQKYQKDITDRIEAEKRRQKAIAKIDNNAYEKAELYNIMRKKQGKLAKTDGVIYLPGTQYEPKKLTFKRRKTF